MAKSLHPGKEVLVFNLSVSISEQINRLANRKMIAPGALLLDMLEEAGVTGISNDRSRRSQSLVTLIRMQVPTECAQKVRELSSSYPSISAWAREILTARLNQTSPSFPITPGYRRKPVYHPITKEQWVTPPFQGDSKWPLKYFQEKNT